MRATDFIEEGKKDRRDKRHSVKPKAPNPVAKHAMSTIGGGGFGAHKDKKKAEKQGDTKHKKRDYEMAEGRHGYDDMGYSLAPGHDEGEPVYNPRYDVVGRGNDRHWQPNRDYYSSPAPSRDKKPEMVGMYFYDVKPGQEDKAASLGVKQTKSGKWAKIKYDKSGRTFGYQKDIADKEFGPGKWWAPK